MAVRRSWRCVAAVLLTACSGGDNDPPPALGHPGTEPPRTTTTDPYAVPAVIDAAYVNRVLAGLDAAFGDIVRLVVTTKSLPPDAIDRLKTVYSNPTLLQPRVDQFQDDLRGQLQNYRPNPGNTKTTVAEFMTATPSCIFAKVNRDFSEVALQPSSTLSIQWIALKPTNGDANGRYNTTGWSFIYDGFERDLSASRSNPCFGA